MKAGIEIAGRTITSLVERKNAEAVKSFKCSMVLLFMTGLHQRR